MSGKLPEWIDGKELYDFIMRKAPYIKGDREGILGYSFSRSMIRWRTGERAHYNTADQLLTRLGLHISEIPEEAWRWSRSDRKDRGIRHLRNGKSPKQVAAWFGVGKSTVEQWQQTAGIDEDEAA